MSAPSNQLAPLPAGLLTVESRPGIAYAGTMRRYEPILALPDGEHKLYTRAALDAAVVAERERCAALLDAEHERRKHFDNYAAFYANKIRNMK